MKINNKKINKSYKAIKIDKISRTIKKINIYCYIIKNTVKIHPRLLFNKKNQSKMY